MEKNVAEFFDEMIYDIRYIKMATTFFKNE